MKYRIDNEYLEHSCCWDTAIIYDCKENKGIYGSNIELLCECDSKNAQFILNALNNYKENNNETN